MSAVNLSNKQELLMELTKAHARIAAYRSAIRSLRKRIKAELDNCTHPECVADRKKGGYSGCAGGHIARRLIKALRLKS